MQEHMRDVWEYIGIDRNIYECIGIYKNIGICKNKWEHNEKYRDIRIQAKLYKYIQEYWDLWREPIGIFKNI